MAVNSTASQTTGLWWDQIDPSTRSKLMSTTSADDAFLSAGTELPSSADVVVVGAGLTGLWTAYYLNRQAPDLHIVVVDQQYPGFGASGRNGSWCSALFPMSAPALARRYGVEATSNMRAAMRQTVVEVGEVTAAENISCDFRQGGTVTAARSAAQWQRLQQQAAADQRWGDATAPLTRSELNEHVQIPDAVGGIWNPDCARLQPARLVTGLVQVLHQRGVELIGDTRVTKITPRLVHTERGAISTRYSVRATEAWTPQLPGSRRLVAPIYSLMVATAPIADTLWPQIGLKEHQTFTDGRNLIIYGARTADNRIVFGGRGAPYHYRSQVRPQFDHDENVFAQLRQGLTDLFPALVDHPFTHAWGGPLGVTRDWQATVGLDPRTGMGWAGGYVGDGVSTTNLAGRTLADLITGTTTALTKLPWVQHRSRIWECEPLRWTGITAGMHLARLADQDEARTGRPSPLTTALDRLTGH